MKWDEAAKERIRRRNRRILLIGCLFTACYLVIGVKAFYVQVVEDADLSRKASGEYSRAVKSEGRRGTIYDANMKELAVSTRVVSVGAHPEAIPQPSLAAQKISRCLDISKPAVERALTRDAPFVWLERKVSPMKAESLQSHGLEGLEYIPGYCRVYPNKSLAAQVLGFTGVERRGLEGLEYYYDEWLRGGQKEVTIAKDAIGRIFHRETAGAADIGGRSLVLTLDSHIQYITEKTLAAAVRKFQAKSGIAVVMVPKTGAVKAIAHYPSFDPNRFGQYPRERFRNRAITDPFEPGSTMKVFTAAAALASGLYTPGTVIDCENGRYRTGGHVINDIHPHESLLLGEVIKYSSNIGAVKIAEHIGARKLYETLRAFGFGEKTGIDCPGETPGRLRPYEQWRAIDCATIAFGQGVSVSALQLISAVSAIANDGVLMRPRIVSAIIGEDGRVIETRGPESRGRAVSPEIAEKLKAMMFGVTSSEGTGSEAVPAGYTVCGKTGTAQKINSRGTYEDCEYNGMFLGFAPTRSPELAVLVVIDEPQKDHYGGVVAAPAFRRIILKSFNYLDIPPNGKQPHYNVAVSTKEKGA
jgi:cell division protein FtsI (penicillin-binding protein 3)